MGSFLEMTTGLLPASDKSISRRSFLCWKGKWRRWFKILLCVYPTLVFLIAWNYLSWDEGQASDLGQGLTRLEEKLPADLDTPFGREHLRAAFSYQMNPENGPSQMQWLREILKVLLSECEILESDEDASLLTEQEGTGNILIAMNLYNSESMMPNLIVQLLRFVSLHEQDRIRISIYESGSTDSTPQWLLFFQKLLEILDVRNRIVVDGNLIRSKNVERIELLAQLRNAAIAPLQEWKAWKAQKVVFINDVFFCTQHILRLLLHDADIACGMDFAFCIGCLPRSLQKRAMQTDLMKTYGVPAFFAFHIPKVKFILRNWRNALPLEKRWSLGVPMVFYDRWVTHDLQGKNFLNAPPYVNDTCTSDFLTHGYPVYVHSCWNGIVSIKAEPFYNHLKFRHQYPEECQASECFFLCHDFAHLGHDRILIDPGVRVAYGFRESTRLYDPSMVANMKFLPWYADGVRHPDMKHNPHPQNIECCILSDGEQANFEHDCRMFDYSQLNCTLRAMNQTDHCTPSLQ